VVAAAAQGDAVHGGLCACARGATAADAEGRRCASPPLVGGVRTPQAGRQRRPTDDLLLLHACSGRRYVYHLKTPRLASRCGHRPCRGSRRAPFTHLRNGPPCCPPALVMQTWSNRAIRGATQAAACTAGCAAARAARAAAACCRKGGGGRVGRLLFFCFCPYSVSNPLFAPFVSAEAVAAAAAAAAGPAPS